MTLPTFDSIRVTEKYYEIIDSLSTFGWTFPIKGKTTCPICKIDFNIVYCDDRGGSALYEFYYFLEEHYNYMSFFTTPPRSVTKVCLDQYLICRPCLQTANLLPGYINYDSN